MDAACPTPWGVPIAVGECPFCSAALRVSIRRQAPVALPAGPRQPSAGPNGCCACPACGEPLYVGLSAEGPLAAPKADTTALVSKDPRLAPTQRLELPER